MSQYERRREQEFRDSDAEHGPGHETYEEQLDRWREDWARELENDLNEGY